MYEFRTLHEVIFDPLKLHLAGSNFPEGDANAVAAEKVIKTEIEKPRMSFFATSTSATKLF